MDETRAFFEQWFESAESFVRGYQYAFKDGDLNKAAFDLHQATERFYQCLFLVRTLYNNLNRLRALAEDMEPALQHAATSQSMNGNLSPTPPKARPLSASSV